VGTIIELLVAEEIGLLENIGCSPDSKVLELETFLLLKAKYSGFAGFKGL
jgi:hypothetical protein